MRQPMPISNPIPFSRDRLPNNDGLARPARIATAGFPTHACHMENGGCHPPESALRVTRYRLQHPVQAAAWGLGASAHRDPKPHSVFPYRLPQDNGCHAVSPRAFSTGRFPMRCGSSSVATAATRGGGSTSADGCHAVSPRAFSKGRFPRGVAAQAVRRLQHGTRGSSSAVGCHTWQASWQRAPGGLWGALR